MIVFKNYFKILLKYKWIILLYTGICIGISVLNTSARKNTISKFY